MWSRLILGLVGGALLFNCSGYKVVRKINPFERYGIRSIAIPMFLNQSSLPLVSAPITEEIVSLLSGHSKLKIYNGESSRADAILLGIITSEDERGGVLSTSNTTFTEGELKDSLGRRSSFIVPIESKYNLSLRIVLIKDPSRAGIRAMRSSIGRLINNNPKIIFNRVIKLTGTFQRAARGTVTVDSPGIVNFTKSKRYFEKSIGKVAKSAASQFQEQFLNAF